MQSAKSIKETLKTSSQAVATDKVSSQPPLSRGKSLWQIKELRVRERELQKRNATLVQARDALKAANLALEAFNYTVAHDLRQYLTAINGCCHVLRELHSEDFLKSSQNYLEEIYQGTLAMDRLIDTLLEFSVVENVDLCRQTIDLSAIVKFLVTNPIRTIDEYRGVFHIAPGILVDADPNLLQIVLNNLIGNACKYAGNLESTVIEFGLTFVDGKRACFVRDNGPGFDMALADRLFLPFQRLRGTVAKGHGIGLATVKRIITRHGGRVWAESQIGKGATFYFTLGE